MPVTTAVGRTEPPGLTAGDARQAAVAAGGGGEFCGPPFPAHDFGYSLLIVASYQCIYVNRNKNSAPSSIAVTAAA